MTKDEALELAIEALENAQENYGAYWPEGIRALYEALAQPDPVLAEREACANIVDNAITPDCGGWDASGIAEDIRARSHHDNP